MGFYLTIHMHRYNKLQHSDCGVKSFTYGVRKKVIRLV